MTEMTSNMLNFIDSLLLKCLIYIPHALHDLGHLHELDADKLAWWLSERQLPSGGLNGRPEKLPDVCYSWWVLATLHMLGRGAWIQSGALRKFILASQVSRVT